MYKTIYTTFLDILPGWCAFRFQEMTSASRKQEVLESWAFYMFHALRASRLLETL